MSSITLNEAKELLKHIVKNNQKLEKEGLKKNAVEFIGHSGIGKTSIVIETAEEIGIECVKLNLAQLEDVEN